MNVAAVGSGLSFDTSSIASFRNRSVQSQISYYQQQISRLEQSSLEEEEKETQIEVLENRIEALQRQLEISQTQQSVSSVEENSSVLSNFYVSEQSEESSINVTYGSSGGLSAQNGTMSRLIAYA